MSDLCANVELYHHRGLEGADLRSFEAHLGRCSPCRAELEALREMDDLLRAGLSQGREEVSWDALAARVRSRIDGAATRRSLLPWAVGLASAAAVLFLGILFGHRPSAPPAPAPVAQKAERTAPVVSPAPAPTPTPADHEIEIPAAVVKPVPTPEPVRPSAPPPAVTAPEVAPKPAPEVVAPKKPVVASKTVAVRGRLERVRGLVTVSKAKAVEGQEILTGQEIVTEGATSLAVVAQADATRLEMGPESRLGFPEARTGILLSDGRLTVDSGDREAGEENVCATPHAEVRFLGTRFTLTAGIDMTRLEVLRGTAEFLTLADGTSRQVRPGQFALAVRQGAPDQKRVDEAIRKGVEFLKTADSPTWSLGPKDSDDLILLTYIHAGMPESDPKFQALLKKILDAPLETTYEVAVQAMALEELHRVKYQNRIAQCAQFLVDNQCKNGQWGYGKPTVAAMDPSVATGGDRVDAPSAPRNGVREFDSGFERKSKPKVTRKIPVRRSREGPAAGDNSNSQYAALGLRACHDAGILIPKDVIQLAKKWWTDSQIVDPKAGKDDSVATGGKVILGVPGSWCYRGYHHDLKFCKNPDVGYSSMTAGAVGALTIYDFILGMDWKKDKAVQNGMAWLVKNWSMAENVGPSEIGGSKPKTWLLYQFYAVERAGILYDTPKFGEHDWYAEGAAILLDGQKPTGGWSMSTDMSGKPTWDTCFAILFLKKATRPLDVASEDRSNRQSK